VDPDGITENPVSVDLPADAPDDSYSVPWVSVCCGACHGTFGKLEPTSDFKGVDLSPPVLTVPPDATINCDESDHPDNTGWATATDASDPDPDIAYVDGPTYSQAGVGATEWFLRTWTATDGAGRTASGVQRIDILVPTGTILSWSHGWMNFLPQTLAVQFTCDSCATEGQITTWSLLGAESANGPTGVVVCDGATVNTLTVEFPSGWSEGPYGARIDLLTTLYGYMGLAPAKVSDLGIDMTPPTVPDGLDPPNGTWTTDTSPTLSWNPSTDDGSGLRASGTYRVVVDGPVAKDYYTTSTNYTPTLGVDGTYTWKVYARDNAGNASAFSAEYTLNIDTTGPFIGCPVDIEVSPPIGDLSAIVTWPAPMIVDAGSGVASVDITHPAGSSFPDGTTAVTITATDNLGNVSTCTFNVTVYTTCAVITPAGAAGFLDRGWPEGVEPPVVGELDVLAEYIVGELISGCFAVCDEDGIALDEPVIFTFYYVSEIGEDFDVRIPLDAGFVPYNLETGQFCFGFETEELAPGFYDIRLGFVDDAVIWLRVEVLPPPPA
jgi:hypothetical protein